MVVPNCTDCAFANDGFYYTPNYNITRGVAMTNGCSCTGYGADCKVKLWPTMYDGTKLAKKAEWTCFQSFGNCKKNPVVRCTWAGNHFQPIHGCPKHPINGTGILVKDKKRFFSNIAWEFF